MLKPASWFSFWYWPHYLASDSLFWTAPMFPPNSSGQSPGCWNCLPPPTPWQKLMSVAVYLVCLRHHNACGGEERREKSPLTWPGWGRVGKALQSFCLGLERKNEKKDEDQIRDRVPSGTPQLIRSVPGGNCPSVLAPDERVLVCSL